MGTRRSRHNKGRKPMYKHFERETIGDAVSILEARPVRERFIPPPEQRGNYTAPKTAKVIELEASVVRYMAQRAQEMVKRKVERQCEVEKIELTKGDRISFSNCDVLLQLFQDRQISRQQLLAGRVWQFNLQRATIQPIASIAWDRSTAEPQYQARGTLSDGQWEAMRRRRAFRRHVGAKYIALADYCLGRDWRRADLMAAMGIGHALLVKIIGDLLNEIAGNFGLNYTKQRASA